MNLQLAKYVFDHISKIIFGSYFNVKKNGIRTSVRNRDPTFSRTQKIKISPDLDPAGSGPGSGRTPGKIWDPGFVLFMLIFNAVTTQNHTFFIF